MSIARFDKTHLDTTSFVLRWVSSFDFLVFNPIDAQAAVTNAQTAADTGFMLIAIVIAYIIAALGTFLILKLL